MKSEKEEQNDEQGSAQKPDTTNVVNKTETEFGGEYKSEDDENQTNADINKKYKEKEGADDKDKYTDRETANDGDDEDSDLPQSEIEVSSLPSPLFDLDDEAKEELADLSMMLHSSAPFAPHHHHAHHAARAAAGGAAAVGVGGVQNYGGVNSAFHRQPSSGGFHHGHHQVREVLILF